MEKTSNLILMNGRKHLFRISGFILIAVLVPAKAIAQNFMLLRSEENYSHLSDSSRNFYNRLKYSHISASRALSSSFGGEIRYDLALKVDENWLANQGFNHSFLQRYSLHAGVQSDDTLRFFVQINSSLESGSRYAVPTSDEDKLNVQNFFLDYNFSSRPGSQLLLRVGRQELNYGSGRLVSVRDGNNSRQYFTGLKLSYIKPHLRVDAFILATSRIKPGLFDNETKIQGNFWGAYSELSFVDTGNFDIYYLGIMREQARFEAGAGRELRHTVAVRYWKDDESFKYNLETAYQFGKFSQGNIRAWTMAIELGYTFSQVLFKPSFALRNDYVSGDHNISDNELNSFNPLYPKGGYFGFNPLIGPSNLIDIHPYATLHLTDKLSFQFDLIYNWR
jgi:hypothetical protein